MFLSIQKVAAKTDLSAVFCAINLKKSLTVFAVRKIVFDYHKIYANESLFLLG